MSRGELPPGAAQLQLADGVAVLRPAEAVFEAMVTGWTRQQLARNLSPGTIASRISVLRRFGDFCDVDGPWEWTATQADDWVAELRGISGSAHSTVLGYQGAIRQFMAYLTDPAYGWIPQCEHRFGTYPVQIIVESNSARHVQESARDPRKRAYTVDELQDLCDTADDLVEQRRDAGVKGPMVAFRTATMTKVAYAWGLRRSETRMLDLSDFGPNPRAPQFGQFGVCYVRYGKPSKGSPPKRRGVLTVPETAWVIDCLEQWIEQARPAFGRTSAALFPTERSDRISAGAISTSFAALCDQAGLTDPGLDFHSLRRSYVSMLVESGYDTRFVQEQVGHEHASTTSIYTFVSPDYRTRVVASALQAAADRLTAAKTAARQQRKEY
jgi:site-specific recombinase XerD